MISALGAGQVPLPVSQNTVTATGNQNAEDRLALQLNIKGETNQQLSNAVSPVVNIDEARNQQKNSLASPNNPAVKETEKSSKSEAIEGEQTEENSSGEELTAEEQKQVQELKKRDAEVKAHEQAHAAVGGSYASAPSYEYTTGPDNKQYAIGGEVQIDANPIPNNPEATIRKMDIVIRAALAPAEPSSQDKQVAQQAQKSRLAAQQQLTKQTKTEQENSSVNNEKEGEGEDKSLLPENSNPLTNTAATEDASKILQTILAYKAN